jgi:uncharacterized protein YjdB
VKSAIRPLLVVVSVALAVACNKPASMTIDPPNPQLFEAGQKTSLRPVFKNDSGAVMEKGRPVAWSSNHPDVATVDANGVVTAVKSGEASIRAVSEKGFLVDSREATTTVNVSIPSRVTVSDLEIVGIGQGVTIKPTVVDDAGRPTKVAPAQIAIKIEDPKIAGVTVAGENEEERYITALSIGETTATATVGKVSTEFKVTVKLPEFTDLKLDVKDLKVKVGDSEKLEPKAVAGENVVLGVPFSFTSADPAIATVDGVGHVSGIAPGKTTVEVKAGEKTVTVPVVVAK